MIYRAIATGIVLFWLVMTGLLVRTVWFPGTSEGLLAIPVDHLFKLMFLHQQESDLILFRDGERLGDIKLEPHRFPPGTGGSGASRDLLTVTGTMILDLPGLSTQRVAIRGAFDLNEANAVQRFDLTLTLHDAQHDPKQNKPSLVITVEGDPPRDQYHYAAHQGAAVLADEAGTPAALLERSDWGNPGLNPAVLSGLARQQSAATQVAVRRGALHTKGEDIETYDVLIRQANALEATVQLSQLGQVLAVQTFAGYSLLDETLAP